MGESLATGAGVTSPEMGLAGVGSYLGGEAGDCRDPGGWVGKRLLQVS